MNVLKTCVRWIESARRFHPLAEGVRSAAVFGPFCAIKERIDLQSLQVVEWSVHLGRCACIDETTAHMDNNLVVLLVETGEETMFTICNTR